MTKTKAKTGRPSKYDTIDLVQLEKLSILGATDKEMASFFNISEKTFNVYKKEDEFLQSIKKGKDIADAQVVKSLYKRACGFSYEETTKEPKKNIGYEDGQRVSMELDSDDMVVSKIVTKEVVPDTAAAFIWLKNRRPQEWSDRRAPLVDQSQHTHYTKVEVVIDDKSDISSPSGTRNRIQGQEQVPGSSSG